MDFSNLSDELKEKASKCTSTEELLELARNEGVELSDEQLEAVSGGVDWAPCPADGCDDVCIPMNCGSYV